MSENIRYYMSKRIRADTVFKDLSRIVREHKLKVRPGEIWSAVSRMFGYENPRQLDDWIGTRALQGPEDHELSQTDLSVRQLIQVEAIIGLGFAESIAKEILRKLRPTGRAGSSFANDAMPPQYNNIGDYHPNRFQDMWGEMLSPYGGFDADTFDLEETLMSWSDQRPMFVQDKELCLRSGGENETEADYIFDLIDDVGFVLDASAICHELATRAVSDDVLINIPSPYSNIIYVHFGANAFPSPYRDVGIEGAYVRYHHSRTVTEDELPDSVEVRVVCSLPYEAGGCWVDGGPMYRDIVMNLRDHLRGVLLSVEGGRTNIMEASIDYFRRYGFKQETYGGVVAEWADYLASPCTAAIHAVFAAVNKRVSIVDAPSTNMQSKQLQRFARVSTEKDFLAYAASESDRYPIVRFMGRLPPDRALETEYLARYAKPCFEIDHDYIEALAHDMQGYGPETAIGLLDEYRSRVMNSDRFTSFPSRTHALSIHTIMRYVGEEGEEGGENAARIGQHLGDLVIHIDAVLAKPADTFDLPITWLAARLLGLDDQAYLAILLIEKTRLYDSRFKEFMLLVNEIESDAVDRNCCWAMHILTGPCFKGTQLAYFRNIWDRWFTQSMLRGSDG